METVRTRNPKSVCQQRCQQDAEALLEDHARNRGEHQAAGAAQEPNTHALTL